MLDFYKFFSIQEDIGMIKFISIDPGIKNFAIRIESIDISQNDSSTVHLFEVVSLIEGDNVDKVKTVDIILRLNEYINSKKYLFNDVVIVLIENQPKMNKHTPKIFHHLVSYFMNLDQMNNSSIIGMSPKFKGKILKFKKGLKGKKLKQHTSKYITEIFEERNDDLSIKIMRDHEKKNDDLADTKAMIESMMIYMRSS